MEIVKEPSSKSPPQPSLNLSVPGGDGFLSHRPMSAGIDSIVQGFRFAATSRKLPATAVIDTTGQVKGNVGTRERMGDNDALHNKVAHDIGRQEKGRMEAMKVQVPIFSAATTAPSLPHNAPAFQVVTLPEEPVPREKMLPPSQSLRPVERGRKPMPQQISGKEKRKRTQSSSSFIPDPERDQSGLWRALPQQDGHSGHIGVSRKDSQARGRSTRANCERATEASSQSDETRPRKRHERPTRISGPQNNSSTNLSPGGKNHPEIIVLDDEIKTEPTDVEVLIPSSRTKDSSNGRNPKLPESVHDYEKYRRDKNIPMHTGQPLKQHIPLPKSVNRPTSMIRGLPSGVVSSSEAHASTISERINRKPSMNNRSTAGSNGTPQNDRIPIDSVYTMDNPSRQPSYKIPLPPHRAISHEELDQTCSGEHKLLMALTALTTEKQSLENRLRETISSFNTQVLHNEASEKKNAELKAQVAAYKDTVSGLKKRVLGVQKFVDGLGNDYNMLNEKKTHLRKSLNELSCDRNELLNNLKEVKDLTEKAGVRMQEWGDSSALLKESNRDIHKLQETIKFLHEQLSENAGLLAVERDRTQSLECQIQDDREKKKLILTAIQNGKTEVMGRFAELKGAIEGKDESELIERLAGVQKAMEMRIEADGNITRNLVQNCSKNIEKLKDREVDATELFLGVERRVSNTSIGLMDLFHETHKMNAEALSYSDGYISYLNTRIVNLEAELKEIHEKYEISLVESAEKGHIILGHELKLKDVLKRCDNMGTQVERGNAVEKSLNESISTLRKTVSALEAQTAEDPFMTETITLLKQKNCNLKKEFGTARDNLQEAIILSQTKDREIETLRLELEALNSRYKEAENKIGGFVEERAGFMALAEEQKMKARIEVETNANILRQRETSRLHNQIKSLEAQKIKLETDNKEFKTMLAEGANVVFELKKEIQELGKQNEDIEVSHAGLLKDKTSLEKTINNLTQLMEASNTRYYALEKILGTTADELSKALEKIDILQKDKALVTGQIIREKQKLEYAEPERSGIPSTARDLIAPRIVEGNLRAALEETEKEKQTSKMEKENSINTLERTKALDKVLRELGDSSRKSRSISNQYDQGDSSNNQARTLEKYSREGVNGFSGMPLAIETPEGTLVINSDKKKDPYSRVATETMESPFASSPPLPPLTSSETIRVDPPRVEKPKSLQDLGLGENQHVSPKRMLHEESDDVIMSEGFVEGCVKVDILPLRRTCPEKRTLTPFTPKPHAVDILENMVDQHPPITPNRPRIPLRARNTRGATEDTKKPPNRSRKDRVRKNRDDQEWSGDEAEPFKSGGGKEEPSIKKNLRGFKEKKRGGKRNL